jgi:hypothetical protein
MLMSTGHDAYGAEPRRRLLAAGLREGLDLRPDSALDHLRAMAKDALGGLVLSGLVDIAPAGTQVALADQAARVLTAGGRLLVVTVDPAAWRDTAGPFLSDLAPGHPLHRETWERLLEARGFDIDSSVGEEQASDGHRDSGDPALVVVAATRRS